MRTASRNLLVVLLTALLCVLVAPHDANSAFSPTPTGTGLRHVVSGKEAATATLVVNADVNTSAAIAVSKLAAGTNTYVLTTTGGVPVWAAPSGGASSAGASTAVQTSDGAGGFTDSTLRAASGHLDIGTAPVAAAGEIRVPNNPGTVLAMRNSGNTADFTFITATTNALTFGDASGNLPAANFTAGSGGTATLLGYNVAVYAANATGVNIAAVAGAGVTITDAKVQSAHPLGGMAAATSPFRFSVGVIDSTSITTFTASAAQYSCPILQHTSSAGSGTSIWNLPNSAGAYYIVDNQSNATLVTLKVAGQTGVTVNVTSRATIYCNGTDYIRVTADN